MAHDNRHIMTKCQPRHEANALRRFLSFSEPTGDVTRADADLTRAVLQKYEVRIKRDLDSLDETLQSLAGLPYLKIFGLDDEMLNRATTLALAGLAAKPFDHAILRPRVEVGEFVERPWPSGGRNVAISTLVAQADADTSGPWDLPRIVARPSSSRPSLRERNRIVPRGVSTTIPTLVQPFERRSLQLTTRCPFLRQILVHDLAPALFSCTVAYCL